MSEGFDDLKGHAKQQSKAMTDALDTYSTQFGDIFTVNRITDLDVESHYQLSRQTNVWEATGSATVSSDTTDSEIQISTTANGGDSAFLETAELGRYVAGYSAEAGMGIRIPQLPTGNQVAEWGYYDGTNGFYFGVDADGVYVTTVRDGTPEKTYQENWNTDNLLGSPSDEDNPSNLELDLSNGNVFRIDFAWYGYGSIRFVIMMRGPSGVQKPVTVHTTSPENQTSVKNPNLPIRAAVDNNGDATAFDMYVGGRQFSIYGEPDSSRRIKSDNRLAYGLNGTTWVPVMSIRRRTGREDVKIDFLGFDIFASDNVVVQIREDSQGLDGTWSVPSDVDPNETAVETKTDVTTGTFASGRQRYQHLFAGGTGTQASVTSEEDIELRPIRQNNLTVWARKIATSGGTISVVGRWKEEW